MTERVGASLTAIETEPWWRHPYTVMAVAGLGLVGALAFLPWIHLELAIPDVPTFTLDRTAVQSPDAALGWAALVGSGVVTLGAAAAVAFRPAEGPATEPALTVGGPLIFGLLVVKVLRHTELLGLGAWISLLLGVVMASCGISAWRRARDGSR